MTLAHGWALVDGANDGLEFHKDHFNLADAHAMIELNETYSTRPGTQSWGISFDRVQIVGGGGNVQMLVKLIVSFGCACNLSLNPSFLCIFFLFLYVRGVL